MKPSPLANLLAPHLPKEVPGKSPLQIDVIISLPGNMEESTHIFFLRKCKLVTTNMLPE